MHGRVGKTQRTQAEDKYLFRHNSTLLWMLEVTTIIPNTPDYQLVVWAPLNEESAEY